MWLLSVVQLLVAAPEVIFVLVDSLFERVSCYSIVSCYSTSINNWHVTPLAQLHCLTGSTWAWSCLATAWAMLGMNLNEIFTVFLLKIFLSGCFVGSNSINTADCVYLCVCVSHFFKTAISYINNYSNKNN